MRIGIFNDEDQIASLAADRILEVYRAKPNFVLGLATGSSPLKLYAELVRRYQAGQISFAQVRSYNLDEYVGLPATTTRATRTSSTATSSTWSTCPRVRHTVPTLVR